MKALTTRDACTIVALTAASFGLFGCSGTPKPDKPAASTAAENTKEEAPAPGGTAFHFEAKEFAIRETGFDLPIVKAEYNLEDLTPPGDVIYSADANKANLYDLESVEVAGEAWTTGFGKTDSVVTWRILPEETRFYTVELEWDPGPASKGTAELLLNGRTVATLTASGQAGVISLKLPSILMDNDVQEFALWTGWEGLKIGRFTVTSDMTINKHTPNATPVNPNASEGVHRVLAFLASTWGKYILSGQYDIAWNDSIDMLERVRNDTGREPAIMGYDFLQITGPTRNFGQTNEAIAYWEKGGLVTFCWHWRMGRSREFYTDKTDFRITRDESSPEYAATIKMIDHVAMELKRLEKAGIPVLWRPLHEASGGWFWWGASGPDDYLWLWNLLYDRLTNHHGLNNLIWVWNGQDKAWYPGDETVDIIGLDIYPPPGDHRSQLEKFLQASSWAQKTHKLVALTENGSIPDPDAMIEDGAVWSYFTTWNDAAGRKDEENFWSGKLHNSLEFRKRVYNHPYVLTLDELPSFKQQ